ncbi:hypothetical protein ES705_37467 [subsurface metagenome]
MDYGNLMEFQFVTKQVIKIGFKSVIVIMGRLLYGKILEIVFIMIFMYRRLERIYLKSS